MEHRGQIAIAELLDIRVDDAYYKRRARIETGDLSGKECYVAYRGDADSLKGDILVRFEFPLYRISNLNLDGTTTSHFITSSIPEGFDSAPSNKVIFCGVWEYRMGDGFESPIIGKIRNYYDIGITKSGLHYGYWGRRIFPYNLYGIKSEAMQHRDSGYIFSIESAIRKYLKGMDERREGDLLPRQVTIDEKIRSEARILNGLTNTHLTLIQMEPQQ